MNWESFIRPILQKRPFVIAGPCAVESELQLMTVARAVARLGAAALRGGAFKPRTSPHSFQGLGEEGLKLLARARAETGLPIVTEVLDTRDVALVAEYADILQIGSRSSQNFPLLKEVAATGKPILLKRGIAMTLDEWLLAAEYIFAAGNEKVIFCERGIRTFEPSTRHTLDLAIVPLLKERLAERMNVKSNGETRTQNFPVIVDPSHGTGRASLVAPMSKAALAAGADGLLIEVHPSPSQALSDGQQSLNLAAFEKLMEEISSPDL